MKIQIGEKFKFEQEDDWFLGLSLSIMGFILLMFLIYAYRY